MRITIDTQWLRGFEDFDDATRLALLEAIIAYLQGEDPNLPADTWQLFAMLRPQLDDELNRRLRLAERSKANGQKGGRKAKRETEPKEQKKGFEKYLEDTKFQGRCDNLLKLDAWKKTNTPYLYANMRPLTQREFECILQKYNSRQICDTLLQIENRKDLRKRYVDPYRTLINWLKKEYGNT